MISFFNLILEQFQQQSLLELIAVALSVLYVIFAAKQSILCWPCAFISTGLFMYLFWDVTLLFQMLLNFYYIVMAIVGYMFWQGGKSKKALKVSTMAISTHAFLIVFQISIFFGI